MHHLGAQWLGDVDLRRPDIARAITFQPQLVYILDIGGQNDAFVVNAHFFVRLKVVIDDHSAIATNQRLTKFHGRQPVHMQVSDESSLEKERHERYVLGLMWHVAGAGTGDCGWISLEHKIHDRKIMDGKVPKYAGVLAEKTEVDAGRIVIID